MNALLLLQHTDGTRQELELTENFLIGRDAPAELVLPLPSISRQHARVEFRGGQYFLADLQSRNGTFVNGVAVTREPWRLKSGDEIVLGGVVTLRFHDSDETLEGARVGRLQGIWMDAAARAVWVDAQKIEPSLSAAQFALLALLYSAPSKIFSRDDIIAAVWPHEDPGGISEEAIDGLIKRLRARLRETGTSREYVEVVRGQGVRLAEPE